MPDGLRSLLGLGSPQGTLPRKEIRAFQRDYKTCLNAIAKTLQYTAAHAQPPIHAELSAKRDELFKLYQLVLTSLNSSYSPTAQAAADQALEVVRRTATQMEQVGQGVERAVEHWSDTTADYEEAVSKIEQLEQWGHGQTKKLRMIAEKIQQQVDANAHLAAVKAVNQFSEKLSSIYDRAAEAQVPTSEGATSSSAGDYRSVYGDPLLAAQTARATSDTMKHDGPHTHAPIHPPGLAPTPMPHPCGQHPTIPPPSTVRVEGESPDEADESSVVDKLESAKDWVAEKASDAWKSLFD